MPHMDQTGAKECGMLHVVDFMPWVQLQVQSIAHLLLVLDLRDSTLLPPVHLLGRLIVSVHEAAALAYS